jgi:hypothetical protein
MISSYMLTMSLGYVAPIILLHLLSSYLKFQQVSMLTFMHIYKVYWPYSASLTRSIHPSPPTSTHSLTGPVWHSCPSLFKCIFTVHRGFTMTFHPWIYCTLVSLIPSITFPDLLPSILIIQQLLVLFVISSSYTDAVYFNLIHYHSLFLSPFHLLPSVSLL